MPDTYLLLSICCRIHQVQDLPLTHDAGATAAEVATIMPHVTTALSKLDELTKV
jgi:hypothetical protein